MSRNHIKLVVAGLGLMVSIFVGGMTINVAALDAPDTDQPQCYQLESTGLKRVSCNTAFINLYFNGNPPRCIRGTGPGCIQDNHCYFVGFGTQHTNNLDAPRCVEWRNSAEDIRGTTDDPGTSQPDDSSLPDSTDIFGVTREDLRNCTGADCLDINPVTKMVVYAINILGGVIGILVTIIIITGGIQYSSAGGDPQKVAQAKKRITNAIIALVSYFFLFVVINYLVPGGIFK